MKHGNLTWLVWKEYRQNRLIVYVTLVLMAIPYAILGWVFWRYGSPHYMADWRRYLLACGTGSLYLSQFAMPMIAGNLIAGERADRSAEFQAYLPRTRTRILAGKLLLALLVAAMIWLPNTMVFCAAGARGVFFGTARELASGVGVIATIGGTAFCVAWLFSSLLTSPTISVCAGIIAPIIVFVGVWLVARLCDISRFGEGDFVLYGSLAICLTAAPICFAIGTWYYLRRVEF
jgi:ABC-type transport system involved in multi-copper enzyme maturation permease subunit